jgi:CRP-like cAMP-binding protein
MKGFEMKTLTENDKKLLFGEPTKSFNNPKTLNKQASQPGFQRINSQIVPENVNAPEASSTHVPNECFLQGCVISINNTYKSVWDIYILLLICYSCITSAYYVAFDQPTNVGLIIWENIVEICFCIDIILRFFHQYRDPESFEYVSDIRKIAKNYLTGWFIVDFAAVFPFNLMVNGNAQWVKLVRIFRLPKFMRLLDQSRFDQLLESILEQHSRQKKMNYLYASKYIYKVIRLILIATTLTYFMGCLWYFITSNNYINPGPTTFYNKYSLSDYPDHRKLIMCCYFALTTLATVGYGDLTPQSNLEKIIGILIMILGIALFSYIMGNFNDVLTNYDKQMGIVDKSADLQVWMTSLSKFTANQPLPRELVAKIDEHFKFFWKNDRLSSLTPDDKYLQQMPKQLKHQLIKYLFDDIFTLFRGFLLTRDFESGPNGSFYYELAFEFLPRKYDPEEFILKQGEVVHEVYLIKEGSVYIYFEHNGQQIGKYFGRGYYFGNYNIFKNVPAEFNFKAIKTADNVQATKIFAIPKQKLLKLLKKYPEICSRMIENSKRNSNSLKDILKHELKLKLQHQHISNPQVDEIFKNAVIEKTKVQTSYKASFKQSVPADKVAGLDSKLQATDNGVDQLMGQLATFNRTVGEELDDIITKLHKLRDQIATKDKIK